jgi:hypothetical protein
MQFTIRTLLIITLIVALFCSAATTFQGTSRYYAIVILAWIILAGVYLGYKQFRSAIIPHILGPIMALGFCILYIIVEEDTWKDRLEILPHIFLIGLFVGIFVGALYVLMLRIRRQIK